MNILLDSHYYTSWSAYARLSESTKRGYTSSLRKFGEFIMKHQFVGALDFNQFYYIEDEQEYEAFDTDFMDLFIEELKELGTSKASLYSSIVAIKSFFRYLKSVGLIEKNPLKYYPNPYYDLKVKDRSFSQEEVNSLLEAAYKLDPFFKQYHLLILLFFTCGLRASELCSLKKSQVNFDLDTIEISRGQKTNADVVVMTENLRESMKNYFENPAWLDWSNGQDREVFFYHGKPLNRKSLIRMLNEVYVKASIHREVRVHDFRYTMAFIMYKSGINLVSIQQQLRHVELETTIHYLPPSQDIIDILEGSRINNDDD